MSNSDLLEEKDIRNNIRNKFLVVDDELARNENDREDFVLDLGVSENLALFAASYEEALEIIKNNSDIAICFVDCQIPRTEASLYNTDSQNKITDIEWGIPLIPEINKFDKNVTIVVYSAYVTDSYLKSKAGKFHNVAGFYGKPNGIKHRKQLYFESLKTENDLTLSSLSIMNEVAIKPSFNYDSLDDDTRTLIQEKTKQIKILLRKSAQDIIDIGRYLTEVKASLDYGQFYPWLESELKWSYTSAARFMQVYRKFGSSNLKDYNLVPSVLYELSANKVPTEAIDEVVRMADSGETITLEVAKSIKKKFSNPKSKESNDSSNDSDSPTQDSRDHTNQLDLNFNTVEVEEPKSTTQTDLEEKQKKSSLTQKVIRVFQRQKQWQIGQHTIVCCDPNSPKFIELLPTKIALVLSFPVEKDWKFQLSRFDSINTFYSRYHDLDYEGLLESIQKTVEITTEGQDNVVVSFIPHPSILLLLNKLGCCAYVADPDYEKCLKLVATNKNI